MSILIKNGRVIDPANDIDEVLDIFIQDNIIKKVSKNINTDATIIIDAKDNWVTPGFIDLHVHLREPGFNYKETIETGTMAGAAGGYTTICAMPNTNPVIHNKDVVKYINDKAKENAYINVLPIGSMTMNQDGKVLSLVDEMVQEGIVAISEDGKTLKDSKLFLESIKLAMKNNIPIMSHCEDTYLKGEGKINEGVASKKFNVLGIPNEMEDVITSRDLILNRKVSGKLHFCHVSTKESVKMIRDSKKRGENVTAEVTPHHFSLCDEDINENHGKFKMAPPIRNRKDVEEILSALQDGTIDAIATDHAPHHYDEKNTSFEYSLNGIVGLETALSISIDALVKTNILTPLQLIEKLSYNPSKIINIDKGNLAEGKIADITIINPNEEFIIEGCSFKSKSKITPFEGKKVTGKVLYTIVNGEIVFKDGILI